MERIAVLVDAQNIYYTTRQAFGRGFDYNAFWKQVTSNRQVVAAFAYSCERGDEKQRQFQNILRAIGFEVKLKPYIQRRDGSAKCDWDVGITIDALECAGSVDTLVLATGDGDFDLLALKLRERYGVTVQVYGVRDLTAASLINAATGYFPIEDDLLFEKR